MSDDYDEEAARNEVKKAFDEHLRKDAVRIYVKSAGCTVEWLAVKHDFNTVLEYNTWQGTADLPERIPEIERTRRTVLMVCDHNQILKINAEMHKGTVAVAECLLVTHPEGILGWDFQRREPMVVRYPCTDPRRNLTPLPEESRS